MTTTPKTTTTGLEALEKPKQKFTLLVVGGGMMGCDVRKTIVSRGWTETSRGSQLCYSAPRARKLFGLISALRHGCIVLRGHEESRPVFEGHITDDSNGRYSTTTMILDGTGGRFVDAGGGADALIAYLKEHMVAHTLTEANSITLLEAKKSGGGDRAVADPDFKEKLIDALGPPLDLSGVDAPTVQTVAPQRKSIFTDAMKRKLKAANSNESAKPIFKLFMPEGSATWLVCSMEEDGDTLWVVADLGMGCVEYGTASLTEIESLRGQHFKLPVERDLHFSGCRQTMTEILSRDSLQGVS